MKHAIALPKPLNLEVSLTYGGPQELRTRLAASTPSNSA
jgi:hypothetical protein